MTTGGGNKNVNREHSAVFVKNWIEKVASSKSPSNSDGTQEDGSFYVSLTLYGVKVLHVRAGLVLCSLSVPNYLTDGDGNLSAGAISGMIDNVCALIVLSSTGAPSVSVDFNVSYFSTAKTQDSVLIEGKSLFNKGKLWSVLVKIKKTESGEIIAIGRQWMSSIPLNQSRL